MPARKISFANFVRKERKAREIGVRQMAQIVGVSPPYISQIERNRYSPPTEERVRAIAQVIECDPDELLAMAGRISADVEEIIHQRPVELSALLRATRGLSRDNIVRLAQVAREMQDAQS